MSNERKNPDNYREEVKDYLRATSPVKTGNLRNSIKIGGENENGSFKIESLDYGKYVLPKYIDETKIDNILENYAEALIGDLWKEIENTEK